MYVNKKPHPTPCGEKVSHKRKVLKDSWSGRLADKEIEKKEK